MSGKAVIAALCGFGWLLVDAGVAWAICAAGDWTPPAQVGGIGGLLLLNAFVLLPFLAEDWVP